MVPNKVQLIRSAQNQGMLCPTEFFRIKIQTHHPRGVFFSEVFYFL
jgi:hypothetical protein